MSLGVGFEMKTLRSLPAHSVCFVLGCSMSSPPVPASMPEPVPRLQGVMASYSLRRISPNKPFLLPVAFGPGDLA